jgi:metal-sulfur cluster biosynthetic enzyme
VGAVCEDARVAAVREALRGVVDPELGYDVVGLGLIYGIRVEGGRVEIVMTMTTPGCPAEAYLIEEVAEAARSVPGVEEVEVRVVWSPPWSPEMMDDDAKAYFGLG